MRFPGFTADASLAANQPACEAHSERHRLEPFGRGSLVPAIPGRSEQDYIDCLTDCRLSGGHNCTRYCTPHTGTSSTGSSSGPSCSPPFTACGNSCADLTGDPTNCGTCGRSCPSGQSCCGGGCAPCCYNVSFGINSPCTDGSTMCCPLYAPFCWKLFGLSGCSPIPW